MNRRAAGFSLIEVLVAFVILSLALAVMMRIFGGGLNNVALAEGYSRAVLLAQSRLAEVAVRPQPGEQQGQWDDGYQWQTRVEPYVSEAEAAGQPVAPQPFRLLRIEVRVSWTEPGRDAREVVLQTLRLAPVAAGA